MTARELLLLLYAPLRRRFLCRCRPAYVRASLARRQGSCRACGTCCRRTRPMCPYLLPDGTCRAGRQPVQCKIFPIDTADQQYNRVGDGCCGYYWE